MKPKGTQKGEVIPYLDILEQDSYFATESQDEEIKIPGNAQWKYISDLNVPRASTSLGEINNTIYGFGGYSRKDKNRILGSIERLDLNSMFTEPFWELIDIKLPIPVLNSLVIPLSKKEEKFLIFGGWNKKAKKSIQIVDTPKSEAAICSASLQMPDFFVQNTAVIRKDSLIFPGLKYLHRLSQEGKFSMQKYVYPE